MTDLAAEVAAALFLFACTLIAYWLMVPVNS